MFGKTIELVLIDIEQRVMRLLCKTEDNYNAECKILQTLPPQGIEGKRVKVRLGYEIRDYTIVVLPCPDWRVMGILDYILNPVNELWIVSGWFRIDPDREIAEFVPGIPGRIFWTVLNARDLLQNFSRYIRDSDLQKLVEDAALGAAYWRNMYMKCCDELKRMHEFAVRVKDETLKFMIEQAQKNIELRRELEEALGIEIDPYLYIARKRRMEALMQEQSGSRIREEAPEEARP